MSEAFRVCAHLSNAVYSGTIPDGMGVLGAQVISDPVTDTFGMAYFTADALYIVFRGSQTKQHWLSNLKIIKKDFHGIRAHKGFAEAAESVLEQVWSLINSCPGKTVVLSGHSLGGAIATLVGVALRPLPVKIVTFGQPRVSTRRELNLALYGEYVRVVNGSDAIVRRPLLGYSHSGTCLYLSNKGTDLLDPGVIRTFLDRLPTLVQRGSDHLQQDYIRELDL